MKFTKNNQFVNFAGYTFDPTKSFPQISIKPNYFCTYLHYNNRSSRRGTNFVTDSNGKKIKTTCKICGCLLTSEEFSKHQNTCNSCLNLESNKHKGDLSDKARYRLLNAIDMLYLLAKKKTAYNEKKHQWFTFRVSMLTLVIPCVQLHDDLFIKKELLGRFLDQMRLKFSMYFYVWRAEKTKAGTIHIHICHDVYAHYSDINKIWNHLLQKHGYIDKYRDNQQNWHKDGFNPRPWLYDSWDYQQQLKAYKKGIETNWSNPSGTTDIHSLKKIVNSRLYMGKYLAKKKIEEEFYKPRSVEFIETQPDNAKEFVEEIFDNSKLKSKLQITGKIWYISQPLSKLKNCINDISEDVLTIIDKIITLYPTRVKYKKYSTVFKISIREIISEKFTPLIKIFEEFIQKIRQEFYLDQPQIYSILGIPINLFEKN